MEKAMRIGFIGAGRVGGALGQHLFQKGYEITGYYSRTPVSARNASELVGGRHFESLMEVVQSSDFIFLTVSDDSISQVVDTLDELKCRFENKIIAHTSGVHASDVFLPLVEKGASAYAIHPLQAFATVEQALKLIEKTVFSIEGSGLIRTEKGSQASSDIAKRLLSFMDDLGDRYFVIMGEEKAIYHAAAVISSNYLVATLDFALSQFERIGCDKAFAMKALFPLIQGTIDNIERLGTLDALTGPIARGDVHTVDMHLSKLSGQDAELYKALGLKTLDIASEKGLSKEKRDRLFNRLKED